MSRDAARIDSIQAALREEGLDALACSLPANVLLLTGYWPVVGNSLAVVGSGSRTVLIVPEDERDLARQGWADEVRTFRPGALEDLHTPEEAIRLPLGEAARSLGGGCKRLGFESGPTVEPASYAAMYLFGTTLQTLLAEAFPSATLVPATKILARLRSVKTSGEIDRIRDACRMAGRAFRQGVSRLAAGLNEHQAAERFHAGLCENASGSPPGRVGGFTWCMSGPNSAKASAAYARSEDRVLACGDLVLIHCNSYADGFWTDITRTYCLAPDSERTRKMVAAVFEARAAALAAIRPGAKAAAVDEAARGVFRGRGWADAFPHSTGHGVGFGAISAQALLRLHPKSDDVLQPGMVFNVEPALYFEGFGGLRHCDMVAVTATGHELLTPFHASPDELILSEVSADGGAGRGSTG